jgi:alpha-mannosidase
MKGVVVHILGQSHIDVAWLWPYYPETIHDCVKLTFTRAVDNLKMHKEYVFAQSQVPLYKAAEEYFPELFSEITKFIKEGRWDVVGGTYVEFEGGEPCGESLVRQCLLGQKYFTEKFGFKARVGWLPDSWTIPWQLPQILRKSGIHYLVFFRGARGEDLFWWEAPDGSRVLACRPLRCSFASRPFPKLEDLAFNMAKRYDVKNVPLMIGSGDHGGGPTYQEIQNIKDFKEALKHEMDICFSTPHRFLESLAEEAGKLPVVRGELDWELVGDLTNCAKLKEENRLSEVKILTAEKFSSIATVLTGIQYPQSKLNSAWEKVLYNQFHDIIGGSAIPSVQMEAIRSYDDALRTADEALEEALRKISFLIDTSDSELSIVVFNSLSWSRTDVVDVELNLPDGWRNVKLIGPDGEIVTTQTIRRREEKGKTFLRIIFIVENVPPLGYKTYRVAPAEGGGSVNPFKISERRLENSFFRIIVSKTTGQLESIFDKENNVELLREGSYGNVIQLIEDLGDSEGRLVPGVDRSNRFTGSVWNVDSKESVEISEKGPVRGGLAVKRIFNNSIYLQEVTIYSKMRRIDFNLTVDWHEVHRALKVEFPFNIANPVLTAGIQYGSAVRTASDEEQPFQQWVDMSEANNVHGVALLSSSKYGYDAKHNVLRLTLLRSPTQPSYNTDEGKHVIKYALYPHKQDWKASRVLQKSYEFNNPLIAFVEEKHGGVLSKAGSFINVEPDSIIVECVKKAESDQSLVLRLYEHAGLETEVEIALNLNRIVKRACKTNILEEEVLEKIEVYGNRLKLSLKPYEICTVKVVLE